MYFECYCNISYKLEQKVLEYQISKTRWFMFLPESLGHINAFKQEPSSDASWHLRHSQLKYQTLLNLSLLFLDPVNNDWYWMVNSSPFLMFFCARISIPIKMNWKTEFNKHWMVDCFKYIFKHLLATEVYLIL